VADQRHGISRDQNIQHQVKVNQVILKPVALRVPARAAITTPVRRYELIVIRTFIDKELECRSAVARTMEQDDRRRIRRPPSAHMTFEAADLKELAACCFAGLIRGKFSHRAVNSHRFAEPATFPPLPAATAPTGLA
jgi:hypothetical protein